MLTMRPVPTGTSGGVSAPGTIAMLAGALFVALAARTVGFPASLLAVAAGGAAGALADSLLGATIQERRWCETCKCPTERDVHRCGSATVHRGGLQWLDNDAVNLLATLVGATVAAALAHL
jgi:uncharacterized membrane protein